MTRLVTFVIAALALFIGAPIASADEGAGAALAAAIKSETTLPIDAYITEAEASIDEFATINNLPHANWVNISGSQTFKSECLTSASTANNAYYFCSLDKQSVIGAEQGAYFNQGTHDLAAAVLQAHEWGHDLQDAVVPITVVTKPHELGADCVGGSWLRWFNDTQQLNLNLGDAMGFANLTVKIQSPPWMVDDPHGSAFERGTAMLIGYTGGLGACNVSYAPIFPS